MYGEADPLIFSKEKIGGLTSSSYPETGSGENFFDFTSERLIAKWSVEAEPTIEMKINELYFIVNRFTKEINSLKNQINELQANNNALLSSDVQKVVVADYPQEHVEHHKMNILSLLKQRKIIDPWDYAVEVDIDVGLALLCFDELIDEGKLEKVK